MEPSLRVKRDGAIFEKTAQRAVTSFSFREGFLSPTRGTEGVVKTIEERLGEKGGALLTGEVEIQHCRLYVCPIREIREIRVRMSNCLSFTADFTPAPSV